MKAQSAALAMAALVLWLIPSGSLAQGNSGKSRLTICHLPPGNPDAGKTMTVSEQAWRAHESHGDYVGPCEGSDDEYGDDTKSAKKKGGKKARSGSDGDDADDDVEADDRADEGEEVVDADTRTRREKRQAERRARHEQSVRDQDGKAADDSETEESATSGDAEEAEAGGVDTETDDTQAAQRRARSKARAERRATQATQPDAETEAPPEEEQGFFRGMRQRFGFGGDEGEESSGEAVE